MASVRASVREHKPNYRSITLFMLLVGAFSMGLSTTMYTSPLTSLIEAKYGWETGSDESETSFEMINISLRLGLIFGSLAGGPLIQKGRRWALLVGCSIGIIGVALSIPVNFALFVASRFILGFVQGVNLVAGNRFIEEYIPLALFPTMVAIKHVFEGIGYMWAFFSVDFLPKDSETAALAANKSYLIIIVIPGIFYIIAVVMMLAVIRNETPKFYIMQGNDSKAKEIIHQIYHTEGSDVQASKILRFFQKTGTKETSNVTLKQTLYADDRYTRATWVSVGLGFFFVYCGYHFI